MNYPFEFNIGKTQTPDTNASRLNIERKVHVTALGSVHICLHSVNLCLETKSHNLKTTGKHWWSNN